MGDTVREMLNSGRIRPVYLDELGEIDRLPIGLGLMILTTIEGDRATTQARRLIDRAEGDRSIIELISTINDFEYIRSIGWGEAIETPPTPSTAKS